MSAGMGTRSTACGDPPGRGARARRRAARLRRRRRRREIRRRRRARGRAREQIRRRSRVIQAHGVLWNQSLTTDERQPREAT